MNTTYEEYRQLRSLNRMIRNTKKRLTNSIMKKVRPLMWDSGYVWHPKNEGLFSDNKRPLKIFIFPKCQSNEFYYKLPNTQFEEFCGFSEEDAIITGGYAGGLATQRLADLTIEELIKLWSWITEDRYKAFEKVDTSKL